MKKWHLIIDIEKCENCNNCFLSCKDEHVGNEWPGYSAAQPLHGQRWMNIVRKERGQYPLIDLAYRPTTCMNCHNAPCIKASPDSVYQRPDGIVMIDPKKASGDKELLKACPYGAIWWNEEANLPQKCTSCAHLLDTGWKQPRCVQACPTGALKMVQVVDDEFDRIVAAEELSVLHPEFNTMPAVHYKNMYRFDKCFIAGSVAFANSVVLDCAAGAKVQLYQGAEIIAEALTDAYGDFKFDRLAENSGTYTVKIELEGHEKSLFDVELEQSVSIGVIRMKPADRQTPL